MRDSSHMGALVALTSISALLAVILGIVGYVADDLETAVALNYWANLFTTATVVGIFAMIVLSGVRAYLTPADAEKPADTLTKLPEVDEPVEQPEAVQEPAQAPADDTPQQRPYRPGDF